MSSESRSNNTWQGQGDSRGCYSYKKHGHQNHSDNADDASDLDYGYEEFDPVETDEDDFADGYYDVDSEDIDDVDETYYPAAFEEDDVQHDERDPFDVLPNDTEIEPKRAAGLKFGIKWRKRANRFRNLLIVADQADLRCLEKMRLPAIRLRSGAATDPLLEKLRTLPTDVRIAVLPRTDPRPGSNLEFDIASHLAAKLQSQLGRPVQYTDGLPQRSDTIAKWINVQPDIHSRKLGREFLRKLQRRSLSTAEIRAAAPALDIPIGMAAFDAEEEQRIQFLIQGILAANEPAIFGGPSKALKTSVMCDLAYSIATATKFLGYHKFLTPILPRRVLILSGESGRPVIKQQLRAIAKSRGRTLRDAGDWLRYAAKLPKLADSDHVAQLVEQIRKYKIDVLIIDPLYLCLLSGQKNVDATNMFEIGPVFADFAEQIRAANCTLVLVHHTTKRPASQAGYRKGKERDPLELSDLAYAGADQFCRQWILLSHREPFDPDTGEFKLWMSVGGSVGHSGQFALDIEKGTLRYDVSDPKCINADFSNITWATTVRTRTEQQTRNEMETKKRTAAVERKKAEKTLGKLIAF